MCNGSASLFLLLGPRIRDCTRRRGAADPTEFTGTARSLSIGGGRVPLPKCAAAVSRWASRAPPFAQCSPAWRISGGFGASELPLELGVVRALRHVARPTSARDARSSVRVTGMNSGSLRAEAALGSGSLGRRIQNAMDFLTNMPCFEVWGDRGGAIVDRSSPRHLPTPLSIQAAQWWQGGPPANSDFATTRAASRPRSASSCSVV